MLSTSEKRGKRPNLALGLVEASGGWNGEYEHWGQEGMKLVREAGVS